MVLDYPSRLDKFEMQIITDDAQVQEDKCYNSSLLLHE